MTISGHFYLALFQVITGSGWPLALQGMWMSSPDSTSRSLGVFVKTGITEWVKTKTHAVLMMHKEWTVLCMCKNILYHTHSKFLSTDLFFYCSKSGTEYKYNVEHCCLNCILLHTWKSAIHLTKGLSGGLITTWIILQRSTDLGTRWRRDLSKYVCMYINLTSEEISWPWKFLFEKAYHH